MSGGIQFEMLCILFEIVRYFEDILKKCYGHPESQFDWTIIGVTVLGFITSTKFYYKAISF